MGEGEKSQKEDEASMYHGLHPLKRFKLMHQKFMVSPLNYSLPAKKRIWALNHFPISPDSPEKTQFKRPPRSPVFSEKPEKKQGRKIVERGKPEENQRREVAEREKKVQREKEERREKAIRKEEIDIERKKEKGLSFSGKPEEKQEREGGKGKTHFKRPTLPDVSGKQGEKRETKKTNCKKTRLPVLSERADKKLEKQVKREEKAERQKETTHFQISRSAVFLENSEEKQERGIERKQRIESENERSHFKRPRSHVFSKISEEKQEKEPERKQEVGKEKEKTHFKRPRCLVFSEKLEEKQEREEIEREEEEDGVICSICASTDGDPLDPIVFCDGCDLMVHASCYGDPLQSSIPEGDWFCCRCEKIAENPTCCLCPVKEGAMKPTIDGKWAHILCALFVPEVFFREPEEREGIDCSKVPLRRFEEGCYLCGTKNGSVIDCSEPKCGAKFHVSCALEKDLCVEYREEKRRGIVVGFCEVHTQLWKKQEETGKFKIVARGHE